MNNNITETREKVLAGAVGAFLFSLVGGILWFVLYQIGFLAAVSGLVGVVCAVKGYTFFAKTKNESVKCLVISSIIAVLVLVAAWYLCVAYDIYLAYQAWFEAGEVDFTYTFFESVQVAPYFFEDSEFLAACIGNLVKGLLFAILGVISYLASREKKKKQQAAMEAAKAAAEAAQATAETAEAPVEETADSTAEQ